MTPLRVGLIGAGGIAGVHIEGWQQLGAQVSVYSRSGSAHLAQQYGVNQAPSLEELLESTDVVSILTPTPSHYDYAMAAFAAGKHVMCEKPLADTTRRAADMVVAAAAAGVQLFPAHVVRYFPEYDSVHHALTTGELAAPQELHLTRGSAAPAEGSWFFNESLGGGIVRDQMIHDLDQARWLAGEVVEVHAGQNPPSVDGILPRPVAAWVELRHASGAVTHLQGEWGPDDQPFRTSIRLLTSDGEPVYTSPDMPAGTAEDAGYLPELDPATSPYTLQIAEFAASLADGSPTRVSGLDGVMAVALAEAAMASIAAGAEVPFIEDKVKAFLV